MVVRFVIISSAMVTSTGGAIPNPCPQNPQARYNPGTSSTSPNMGTPSVHLSTQPPQVRALP